MPLKCLALLESEVRYQESCLTEFMIELAAEMRGSKEFTEVSPAERAPSSLNYGGKLRGSSRLSIMGGLLVLAENLRPTHL